VTGEVLFEIIRKGNAVQVSAVDVATNTEVSIMGPAGASSLALQNAALQKLRYVLAKKKAEESK
jgi:hypothetical protein